MKEACLAYFCSTPILKRLLIAYIPKYKSFGTARGSVVLHGISPTEIEILEGFTGKNYHGKKQISLSAGVIQKVIDKSRFQGVLLDELLALYCDGNLKSKKEEREDINTAITNFYGKLQAEHADTRAGVWLESVLSGKSNLHIMLEKKYREKVFVKDRRSKEAEEKLWREMNLWMVSIDSLPIFTNQYEYLPSYAAAVTGDPHYYDDTKEYTIFLYYAIGSILKGHNVVSATMSAEEKHELLFSAGIIKDNVSNDAMVYGIRAWKEEGEHLGIAGFVQQKEPISISLITVMGFNQVKCLENCIYVVENPVVFAQLIKKDNISVLCVNGQPNLAVLLLLDLIVKCNGNIYYSGDFDPEGLLIAQRLKNRYEAALHFWHYEETDFYTALSERSVSERRLKMLDKLSSSALVQIGELLKKHKAAGYQERIFLQGGQNVLRKSNN